MSWKYTFNFSAGPQGWAILSGFGQYAGGQFVSTNALLDDQLLRISLTFPTVKITSIKVVYSTTYAGNLGSRAVLTLLSGSANFSAPLDQGAGPFTTIVTPNVDADQIVIGLDTDVTDGSQPLNYISQVVLDGEALNPFIQEESECSINIGGSPAVGQ